MVNPNYYLALGKYDVEHKLAPQAAEAYQAAIDHGADAVSVSNRSRWLVNYYYDHGQPDRSFAIAREAAETYSYTGLETLAGLLERMDRNQDAESYYEKIRERYNDAKPLEYFRLRTSAARSVDPDEMESIKAKVFPQGMQQVAPSKLAGEPARGVLVRDENALTRGAGLKAGAVVVAVDGKRVSNTTQFAYLRALSASPDMDFFVYQDGRYQAIHLNAPGRRLGVQVADWPEQK